MQGKHVLHCAHSSFSESCIILNKSPLSCPYFAITSLFASTDFKTFSISLSNFEKQKRDTPDRYQCALQYIKGGNWYGFPQLYCSESIHISSPCSYEHSTQNLLFPSFYQRAQAQVIAYTEPPASAFCPQYTTQQALILDDVLYQCVELG